MKRETERLIVRDPVPQDAQFLAKLWSNVDVTKHSGGPRVETEILPFIHDDIIKTRDSNLKRWVVFSKDSGHFLGECGVVEKDIEGRNELDLIYYFMPESWGKGIAFEAASAVIDYLFSSVGLKRVVALIAPQNTSSEKLARKLGFHLERTIIRDNKTKNLYALMVK